MPRTRNRRWMTKETMSLEAAIVDARDVVKRALAQTKKPLIAFSGGKDSVAIALLAREQGVRHAICDASFYFKSMIEDVERLGRDMDLDMEIRIPLTNFFFKEHPEMMFPTDTKVANTAYAMMQRRTVNVYAQEIGADCVFFGRRLGENFVGDRITQRKSGVWHCFPIKLWTTVQTMNYCKREKIELPRLYKTPMGDDCRLNDWPFLDHDIYPQPFETIYHIDPDTVREVATFNDEARAVIERHEGVGRNH